MSTDAFDFFFISWTVIVFLVGGIFGRIVESRRRRPTTDNAGGQG